MDSISATDRMSPAETDVSSASSGRSAGEDRANADPAVALIVSVRVPRATATVVGAPGVSVAIAFCAASGESTVISPIAVTTSP